MHRRISIKTVLPVATLAAPIILFALPSLAAPLIYNTNYFVAPR